MQSPSEVYSQAIEYFKLPTPIKGRESWRQRKLGEIPVSGVVAGMEERAASLQPLSEEDFFREISMSGGYEHEPVVFDVRIMILRRRIRMPKRTRRGNFRSIPERIKLSSLMMVWRCVVGLSRSLRTASNVPHMRFLSMRLF